MTTKNFLIIGECNLDNYNILHLGFYKFAELDEEELLILKLKHDIWIFTPSVYCQPITDGNFYNCFGRELGVILETLQMCRPTSNNE